MGDEAEWDRPDEASSEPVVEINDTLINGCRETWETNVDTEKAEIVGDSGQVPMTSKGCGADLTNHV